jgi:hypothetical protein
MPQKGAHLHLLHHVCASIAADYRRLFTNPQKIQSVKTTVLHGTVFAAFYRITW